MKIGLFSSVKNEGPFLLEWVAYHRCSGFGPIVICSNDSTDGTTELLDAMDAKGLIHHIFQHLHPDEVPQHAAAEKAFVHPAFADADWLMWLDADEFLYCKGERNKVRDLVTQFEDQADGICINWLNFGDNDIETWRPDLVTRLFTHRGPDTSSRHIMFKTLFKKSNQVRGFGLHRPFLKGSFRDSGRILVNSSGMPMHDDVYRSGAFRRHALGDAPADLVAHDAAAVFHYAVKTRDCFEAKRIRGQGTKALNADDRSSRFRERYWNIYNQNEVTDERMLPFVERTSQEMARMLQHPEISEAHSACIRRYGELLAAI